MANGHMLDELRKLSNSDHIDGQAFRQLTLAALADLHEKINEHAHPELKQDIETLKKRDWLGAAIVMATAIAARFVKP